MSDAGRAPAELTWRALAVGLGLGAVLAAANVYSGLKAAFIDYGTLAIVMLTSAAFGHGPRRFTVQEANVAQVAGTAAAAMALGAGMIGPIPALVLGGEAPSMLAVVPWAIAAAALGTVLAIPWRARVRAAPHQLRFPSYHAAGTLLRDLFGDSDRRRPTELRGLGAAALAAGAVVLLRDQLGVVPAEWLLPWSLAGEPLAALVVGVSASPLFLGVGALAGLASGLSLALGAGVAWAVIAPELVARGVGQASYGALVPWLLWPGTALMLGATLTELAAGAVARSRAAAGGPRGPAPDRALWRGSLAAAGALIAIGWLAFGVHPLYLVLGVALAVMMVPAAVSAAATTDNTPAGPLGGLGQLATGATAPGAIAPPLYAGAVINGVATHSALLAGAWRVEHEVGGCTPRAIITAQLAGIAVGAAVAVGAYQLIAAVSGIGTAAFPTPAVASWRATADAVAHGIAGMPAGAPLAALLGLLVGASLALLRRAPRLAAAVPSPAAAGMGFILPAASSVTFLIGALAARLAGGREPGRGVLAAGSGLILGEAIVGLAVTAVSLARS